jgi:hypothetical protein
MMKTYSRRLLSPFIGVVQVAELPNARALSLDGRNWEVHYARTDAAQFRALHTGADPNLRFRLVATIENGALKTRADRPSVPTDPVHAAIDQLYATVTDASLPFDAADDDEYWLLDDSDGFPLALLQTRVAHEHRDLVNQHRSWVAMPAAQLEIPNLEESRGVYVPPVNYRLERAVEQRAGSRPRAIWLRRDNPESTARSLPSCLLREDWQDEEERQLCASYINRLAPRLLMLPELPRETRRRLEIAACVHVFDVERFHGVYPEVVDDARLKAARVEAKLRRSNSMETTGQRS